MSEYEDLCRFIAEHIVRDREAVSVTAEPRGRNTVIELCVAEEDKGKIIGKGGRNIDALRAVVRAAGLRRHKRVQVELGG
ncbi:MAG: KH domain-containing protein [Candidatus Dormibacteria bacterium]